MEDTLLGEGAGAVLHEGLMIKSCQVRGSLTNTFSSNHFSFFQSWKGYTVADKALTKIMEVFILQVNS